MSPHLVALCLIILSFITFITPLSHIHKTHPNKNIGIFWQVTDPHVDLEYEVGTNTMCDVPLCCRVNLTAATTAIAPGVTVTKGLSSSNKQPESLKALPYGTMGAPCDIPQETWRKSLEWIKSTFAEEPADFVIYSGDNIQHAVWKQSAEELIKYSELTAQDLFEVFGKDTPVYPSIGNHDGSNQVNELPYKGANKERYLKSLDDTWGAFWLRTEEARKDLREWGYYHEIIPATNQPGRQKIRLVNLNSQWVNPLNFWLYSSATDLSNSLEWIENAFKLARAQGEKVFISGHIPPGISRGSAKPESLNFWNEGLEKLLVEYADLVLGATFGHTHEDDFGIFHDYSVSPPKPTLVAFTGPALTPYHGDHYPAVRKFYYDRDTGALLDHETFYHNLTQFHQQGGDFNSYWKLEYSASEAWGLESLSPSEVQKKIYDPLWNNDAAAWEKFDRFYYVLYPRSVCGQTDYKCKRNMLCSMGHMDFKNYMQCAIEPWPRSA